MLQRRGVGGVETVGQQLGLVRTSKLKGYGANASGSGLHDCLPSCSAACGMGEGSMG